VSRKHFEVFDNITEWLDQGEVEDVVFLDGFL